MEIGLTNANQDEPSLPDYQLPEAIEWQEFGEDGTKYALLEGVREVADAPFTYAFFIPASLWDAPHYHSRSARIRVLAGELRLGYGKELDKTRTQTIEVGQDLLVPGEVVHFDGAEVDTIIIGRASGVWATTYLKGEGI